MSEQPAILTRLRAARATYPRQFWLLFWGVMISTTGQSMIWPFLMIYVSEKLAMPLTQVATLMTLNAAMGLIFSFIAGPAADRMGRKGVMVISLAVSGVGYLLMSQTHTFSGFALVMGLSGAFGPLYRIGSDAMMADMIPQDQRVEAYSLLRLSNNIGVAMGPSIGGFIATSSYTVAFYLAAIGLFTYSLLIFFFARETLPSVVIEGDIQKENRGYGKVLRDTHFLSFTGAFTLVQFCAAMVWVLLAVYAKTYFHIPERLFGFIPTTNALMVVTLQMAVTRFSKRYPPLRMLALGSLFYAVAVGSIALGTGFWSFWAAMVILTTGELILVPTSTTYVANLAPADMRGRYMSIYGLTWGMASGLAPVLGGFLSDQLGPKATWVGGFAIGMFAVSSFLLLSWRRESGARHINLTAD